MIPVAIKHILCETPRLLSAEDLLRVGCPLKLLKGEAKYSPVELLSVHRQGYSWCETIKTHSGGGFLFQMACSPQLPQKHSSSTHGRILAVNDGGTKMRFWDVATELSVPYSMSSRLTGTSRGRERQPTKHLTVTAMKKEGRVHQFGESEEGFILCVVFLSTDSVVTGDIDGCIKRWDVTTGDCLLTIPHAHTGGAQVSLLAAIPSCVASFATPSRATAPEPISNSARQRIVSVSDEDHDIKIWDAISGILEFTLCDNVNDWCTAVVALRDGVRVVTGSSKGTILLWSIPPVKCSALHGNISTVAAESSSSQSAAAGNTYALSSIQQRAMATSSTLTSSSDAMPVQLEHFKVLQGHTHMVSCLVELLLNRLASSSSDGSIRIWDLKKAAMGGYCCTRVIYSVYDYRADFLVVLGDGETLISYERRYSTAYIWDTVCDNETNPEVKMLFLDEGGDGSAVTPVGVSILADGMTVAWADAAKGIFLWKCL
jgi:WD40 repeat protein